MNHISRRELVTQVCAWTVISGPFMAWAADASKDLPALDANDSIARALGFVNDAAKVDPSRNPQYKPHQRCSGCALFQGKAEDARSTCAVIPGRTVPATGWCQAWVQRPA